MYAKKESNLAAYDKRDRNIESIVQEYVQREVEIQTERISGQIKKLIISEINSYLSGMQTTSIKINLDSILNSASVHNSIQQAVEKYVSNQFSRW